MRQAWADKVKPCLVINKLDRLITELKLDPEEAYLQLSRILESVNVIMATLFAEEVLRQDKPKSTENGKGDDSGILTEEELDDSEVYFSPERGNVLFACAKFGWGFRIQHFVEIYAKRLNMNKTVLNKTLWGEYFFNPKDKTIKKTSNNGKYPRMFVQFILKNIWHVYKVVLEDRSLEGTEKVLKVLGVKPPAREMRVFADTKRGNPLTLLTTICRQWLPLASAIIYMCIEQLPNPIQAQSIRIPKLFLPNLTSYSPEELKNSISNIEKSLLSCGSTDEDPVVLFISKVFTSPLGSNSDTIEGGTRISLPGQNQTEDLEIVQNHEKFIGFGRIFSGTLKKGQEVYVLGPKYNPHEPEAHITKMTAEEIYVLMGRGLEQIDEIPAGNIFGLGGIDDHILKTATICSTPLCFPMLSVQFVSILKNILILISYFLFFLI